MGIHRIDRMALSTPMRFVFSSLVAMLLSLCEVKSLQAQSLLPQSSDAKALTDPEDVVPVEVESEEASDGEENSIAPVNLLQEASPRFTPQASPSTSADATSAGTISDQVRQSRLSSLSSRRASLANLAGSDRVLAREGVSRGTTDAGDLLRRTNGNTASATQTKNPISHDNRIRGNRLDAGSATGSYWVPARIDLDTALSKFDSRQVETIQIVPGPFTSRLGPAFSFTDVELLRSPRYSSGYEMHGTSAVDFKANGDQWLGHQGIAVGDRDWGSRFSYAHRTGVDYRAGNGDRIPSSYNSREILWSAGRDISKHQSIEVSLLRLDQTGVEYPGYAFDMDDLVTDGYDVTHTNTGSLLSDTLTTTAWYNRTRFNGDAQNPSKRRFFSFLNQINYVGTTDVDSLSTGYRQMLNWGTERDAYRFSVGHDLRFVRQELNEISSVGGNLGNIANRNSPIPESYSVNPGLFMEYSEDLGAAWTFRTGARLDYTETDITDEPAKLAQVGLDTLPASYADIMGTNQYQRDFQHYSAYMSLDHRASREVTYTMSLGYAERPPNLTELYAAQPFMFVLQNGLNSVTGDPRLKDEKLVQFDLGWKYESKPLRAGVRGFYSWAMDYITFENTGIRFTNTGDVGQVALRYVNTDLATFLGGESFAELFPDEAISPFCNVRYVEGRDRTRHGDFATTNGAQGNPSQRFVGALRGAFSNIIGADSEPLPGIAPLEARLGVRFNDTTPRKKWSVELSARLVDQQNRVATSLLESPTAGFAVWDLRTMIHPLPTNRLTIALGVENFTDKNYREHFDFRASNGLAIYQPGINFYWGANLDY